MRRVTLLITLLASFGAIAAGAPAALADSLGVAVSTTSPEQGIPLTITVAGSGAAIDTDGDGPYLYAVARPAGGTGCQSSFGADQAAAGDVSTVLIDGDEQDPGEPFSEQASFDPDQGGSIVCAWLESDGDDGDDVATPDEVSATTSTSFTAADPQVGPLKVSVPSGVQAGQAYDITYQTQTDQDLTLDSIVIPAGGSGCASSYEVELDDFTTPDDIFGGTEQVYGPATTAGIDTESTAGSYVICTWIEGSDDQEVLASAATKLKVAGAVVSASSSGGSGGSAETTAACVVPKYSGLTLAAVRRRLVGAGCSVGAVRRADSRAVKAGEVIRLGAAPGRHLKPGAAVSVTVSRGA